MTNELAEAKPLSEVIAEIDAVRKRASDVLIIGVERVDILLTAARECEALREQLANALKQIPAVVDAQWEPLYNATKLLLDVEREKSAALESQLSEAKNVQVHTVTMPDGSTPLGQCTFDGCQYGQITDLRASLAEREKDVLALRDALLKHQNAEDRAEENLAHNNALTTLSNTEPTALAIEQRIRDQAIKEVAEYLREIQCLPHIALHVLKLKDKAPGQHTRDCIESINAIDLKGTK